MQEIAHRVRDLYATLDLEQQAAAARAAGRPPPDAVAAAQAAAAAAAAGAGAVPGRAGSAGSAGSAGGDDAGSARSADSRDGAGAAGDAAEDRAARDAGEAEVGTGKLGEAALREEARARLTEALGEIAGAETLAKPWHVGKTERVVKDMIELAESTTMIRETRLAQAYDLYSSSAAEAALSAAAAEEVAAAEGAASDDEGGSAGAGGAFDVELLLGKARKTRRVDYESPQIAPAYMQLAGESLGTSDADGRAAPGGDAPGAPVDVAERYEALRTRQGIPPHVVAAQAAAMDRERREVNSWLADGPVLLSAARPPRHARPADPPGGSPPSPVRGAPARGGASARSGAGGAPAGLWALEVARDGRGRRAAPGGAGAGAGAGAGGARRAPVGARGDSPYQPGGAARATGGRKAGGRGRAGMHAGGQGAGAWDEEADGTEDHGEDGVGARRVLSEGERRAIEELRALLTGAGMIDNVSPALLQAAGFSEGARVRLLGGPVLSELGAAPEAEVFLARDMPRGDKRRRRAGAGSGLEASKGSKGAAQLPLIDSPGGRSGKGRLASARAASAGEEADLRLPRI